MQKKSISLKSIFEYSFFKLNFVLINRPAYNTGLAKADINIVRILNYNPTPSSVSLIKSVVTFPIFTQSLSDKQC